MGDWAVAGSAGGCCTTKVPGSSPGKGPSLESPKERLRMQEATVSPAAAFSCKTRMVD